MTITGNPHSDFMAIMRDKFGERIQEYLFPPPVFIVMQGEFVELNLESGSLTTRFPILKDYLNPYGSMQGGMIAAAVDNTLGPLSVALAPPSVTRNLELKYSHPAYPEMGYIVVQARLVERKDPKLIFEARVSSPEGQKLATAKATHWMIDSTTLGQ